MNPKKIVAAICGSPEIQAEKEIFRMELKELFNKLEHLEDKRETAKAIFKDFEDIFVNCGFLESEEFKELKKKWCEVKNP